MHVTNSDDSAPAPGRAWTFINDHDCTGVFDLIPRFGLGECGVDQSSDRPDPPSSHHRDEKLRSVREHDRYNIPDPDAEIVQLARESLDALSELTVGQDHLIITNARLVDSVDEVPHEISST